MKKPVRVSPSQLKTDDLCRRKWGFIYLEGRREPPSPKMQFGTDVHTILEIYGKTGELPPDTPEGRVAKQIMRPGWVFPPTEGSLIEQEFSMLIKGEDRGIFYGFIDRVLPPVDKIPEVQDYKTTSDLRYALTEEDLRTDPQSVIYSRWAMQRYGVTQARVSWLYSSATGDPKKPRGARRVSNVLQRGDNGPWNKIIRQASELVELRCTKPDVMTLEPSPSACSAYGGCPFEADCDLSGGQRIMSHIKQFAKHHKESDYMKLSEKLAKKNSKKEETKKEEPTKEKEKEKSKKEKVKEAGDKEPINSPEGKQEEKPKEEKKETKTTKTKAKKTSNDKEPALVVIMDALFRTHQNIEPVQLIDLLQPMIERVCTDNDKPHIGLIQYAEGYSMLARLLDEELPGLIKKHGQLVILADSWTKETQAVKEVLYRHASAIIQGVR